MSSIDITGNKHLLNSNRLPVARALHSYLRGSASKARLVADLIRSRSVPEALNILALCPKRAARHFDKLIRSAVANAINNHGMSYEGLYIYRLLVNEGPTLMRQQPHQRGQSFRIRKRSCHLEVLLANRLTNPQDATTVSVTREQLTNIDLSATTPETSTTESAPVPDTLTDQSSSSESPATPTDVPPLTESSISPAEAQVAPPRRATNRTRSSTHNTRSRQQSNSVRQHDVPQRHQARGRRSK